MTVDANTQNATSEPESYRLGLDAALKEAIQAFIDVRFVPEDVFGDAVFGDAAAPQVFALEESASGDYAAESYEPESFVGYSAPTFARHMLTVPEPEASEHEAAASAYKEYAPGTAAREAAAPASKAAPARKQRDRGSAIRSLGKAIGELAHRGKHAKASSEELVEEPAEQLAEEQPYFDSMTVFGEPAARTGAYGTSLKQWLDEVDAPFSTTLLRLIDERGYDDVDVYKRAGMSRQLFSRIRSDAEYRPAKKTVLALAVALRLNAEEARDLLERAGFALSRSDKRDLVVEYFLENGMHDLMAVNQALYDFDQPLL